MSDSTKLDWLDIAKGVGTALATTVVGVLVRLLFGRAMKGIDDKLASLEKSNDGQTLKLDRLRHDLGAARTEIAVLKTKVEALERPPPAPTPVAQ